MSIDTSYKPTADDVRRLREETGAGMIDCRNALVRAAGDFESAKRDLADQGMAKADKKSAREANEGLIGSYIHAGGKIGVLVEIRCETDFVARNEKFAELVRDVAMHIAAMSPTYLRRDVVPAEKVAEARAELSRSVPGGKPPAVVEKILEGKLNKWFEEHVLLDQPFIKDDAKSVGELIGSVVGVLGEKIEIRRFAKFALGEG